MCVCKHTKHGVCCCYIHLRCHSVQEYSNETIGHSVQAVQEGYYSFVAISFVVFSLIPFCSSSSSSISQQPFVYIYIYSGKFEVGEDLRKGLPLVTPETCIICHFFSLFRFQMVGEKKKKFPSGGARPIAQCSSLVPAGTFVFIYYIMIFFIYLFPIDRNARRR